MFNPPLVHHLAAGPAAAPRPFGRLVAVARGDGAVGVYDVDAAAEGGPTCGQAANRRHASSYGSANRDSEHAGH